MPIHSAGNTTTTLHQPNQWELFFFYFHVYILPLIILFGLVGNTLSIVVCLSHRLRRIPSSFYLTALAIYDSLALFVYLMLRYELSFHFSPNDTEIGCRFLCFMLNIATCLSAWSVTAFTVERFIVVYYPLHRASICTPRKAKIILLAQLPYPLLINLPFYFIMGLDDNGTCDVYANYTNVNNVLGILDAVTSCLIPVLVIVTLNLLIVKRLLANAHSASPEGGLRKHDTKESAGRDRSVTRMLIIVSSCFIILNLPGYVLRCRVLLLTVFGRLDLWTELDGILEHLFHIFYIINFALDFVLYNVSSKNFRKVAYAVFLGKCATGVRGISVRNATMTTSLFTSSNNVKMKKERRVNFEEETLLNK